MLENTTAVSLDDLQTELFQLRALEGAGRDGDLVIALHRFINRAHALLCSRVGDFDRDGLFACVGALSMNAWLRAQCNLNHTQAAKEVRLGRRLAELPSARLAFGAGDINIDQASFIGQTVENVGNQPNVDYAGAPEEPRNVEEALVHDALRFNSSELSRLCKHTELAIDPDGPLKEWERSRRREYLECSEALDGMLHVQGLLAPESAAVVLTALDAAMAPPKADDKRGASERRASALVDLLRLALDAGRLPTHDGVRPLVALTVDVASLQGGCGEAAVLERTGQPLPGKVAERLLCDCDLTPILRGEQGEVLQVGRRRRLFTPKQSLALALRDKHCVFPGCDRIRLWCQNHHLATFGGLGGGPTSTTRGAVPAASHHVP